MTTQSAYNPGNVTPQALPFFNSLTKNEEGGAKAFPVDLTFGPTTATSTVVQYALNEIGLMACQAVWIDNSASPAPTTILFSGTRQAITAKPFTQGMYRVLGQGDKLDCQISNSGGQSLAAAFLVHILFLNIVADSGVSWGIISDLAAQGSQAAQSGQGAASAVALTFPAIPGRKLYIASVSVAGLGATAAAGVNLSITNVDNLGAPATWNIGIAVPAGVAVALQPVFEQFQPPVHIVDGQGTVVTLPSFGLGNTYSALTVQALYI